VLIISTFILLNTEKVFNPQYELIIPDICPCPFVVAIIGFSLFVLSFYSKYNTNKNYN